MINTKEIAYDISYLSFREEQVSFILLGNILNYIKYSLSHIAYSVWKTDLYQYYSDIAYIFCSLFFIIIE